MVLAGLMYKKPYKNTPNFITLHYLAGMQTIVYKYIHTCRPCFQLRYCTYYLYTCTISSKFKLFGFSILSRKQTFLKYRNYFKATTESGKTSAEEGLDGGFDGSLEGAPDAPSIGANELGASVEKAQSYSVVKTYSSSEEDVDEPEAEDEDPLPRPLPPPRERPLPSPLPRACSAGPFPVF